MSHYVPPTIPPPGSHNRSRGSSAASGYVPEGYPVSHRQSDHNNEGYLAPPGGKLSISEDRPFTPVAPEQYRTSGEYRVPEDQLHPNGGPDASLGFVPTPDGYVRPAYGTQYSHTGSIDSRHSHQSHHSAHSHAPSAHSHGPYEASTLGPNREHGSERRQPTDAELDAEQRRMDRMADEMEDEVYEKPLKRTKTKRPTLGDSMVALWGSVRGAVKCE